ncbi:hypothetical protein KHP57_04840 [Algiphilus sp. NNCM1]|nr:hypothetical protein [Algiphilus acroporae]
MSKPRAEGQAAQALSRQGYEVFLPGHARARRRNRRWVDQWEPLFPRYLFIGITDAEHSVAPVRSTPGVTGMVRFGHQLICVPESFIDALRRRCEGGQEDETLADRLPIGSEVEVEDGPMRGQRGILEEIFASKDGEVRVVLLMQLLGRQNRVHLKANTVRRDSAA